MIKLSDLVKDRKVGIVLGGGGFKGAFQVGVLCGLCELGLELCTYPNEPGKIDYANGNSVGAPNGAGFITRGPDGLLWMWDNIITSVSSVFLPNPKIFRRLPSFDRFLESPLKELFQTIARSKKIFESESLFDSTPFREIIMQYIDGEKLLNSPVQFEVICANETLYKSEVISNRDPNMTVKKLKEAIFATTCIRGYCAPVRIDDCIYSDGGTVMPIPLTYAVDAGCDLIFLILNSPEEHPIIPKKMNWLYGFGFGYNLASDTRETAHLGWVYKLNHYIKSYQKQKQDFDILKREFLSRLPQQREIIEEILAQHNIFENNPCDYYDKKHVEFIEIRPDKFPSTLTTVSFKDDGSDKNWAINHGREKVKLMFEA